MLQILLAYLTITTLKAYQAVHDNDFLIFQDKLSISFKDPIKDTIRSLSYSSVNNISFRV